MRQFGELEAAVMEHIWRHSKPVLVRDVLEDLQADRTIAYTTVMTVMDKLHRKGWLRREPQGRAYIYEALASRESYTARLMRDAWSTSENQAVAFVHFLEQLSEEEARALRTALEICPPDASSDSDSDSDSGSAPASASGSNSTPAPLSRLRPDSPT